MGSANKPFPPKITPMLAKVIERESSNDGVGEMGLGYATSRMATMEIQNKNTRKGGKVTKREGRKFKVIKERSRKDQGKKSRKNQGKNQGKIKERSLPLSPVINQ